jgi:hypothetical protein
MRRGVDRLGVVIVLPAGLLELWLVDPIAAKAELSGRPQVRQQRRSTGSSHRPTRAPLRSKRREDRPRIVIAVVGHLPRRRDRAPCDQPKEGCRGSPRFGPHIPEVKYV